SSPEGRPPSPDVSPEPPGSGVMCWANLRVPSRNARASGRKPKTRPSPARRLGSAERSERELALGRRTARIRRIDRLCVPAKVRENPLDRCGRLDAGDHTKAAAAAPARLDLDGEYPLEALRPRQGQGPLPIGDEGLAALTGDWSTAPPAKDDRSVRKGFRRASRIMADSPPRPQATRGRPRSRRSVPPLARPNCGVCG